MRTADAIKIMALAADARVVAFIKEYERTVIDPATYRLIEMWERADLHARVWKFFYGYAP
jgi:hypothetical protein